jgi:signal-transduction protein with cAMP-binding, CBS, and nucleotidyltransferase domain
MEGRLLEEDNEDNEDNEDMRGSANDEILSTSGLVNDLVYQNRSTLIDADHADYLQSPLQKQMIEWRDLNQDFWSTPKDSKTVEQICHDNGNEKLDLRPYMIERPYTVSTRDKIGKIMAIFKQMQLRQIPVVNEIHGTCEGIITRQDLFAYMSL